MAQAPQFTTRDGSGTARDLVFTTNREGIILSGIIDINTVDVQISVNNQNFVSDPSLVLLDGQTFTIPNPASYPDGLAIALGINSVRVRAIDIVGSVSPNASATVTRVEKLDAADSLIPSGIKLHRKRDAVEIHVAKPALILDGLRQAVFGVDNDGDNFPADTTPIDRIPYDFQGLNIYASTTAGGVAGYFKVNSSLVTTESSTVDELHLGIFDTRVEFNPTDYTTEAQARLRFTTTIEDTFGTEIALVQTQSWEFLQDLTLGLPSVTSRDVRIEYTGYEIERKEYIVFEHNRAAGNEANTANSDMFGDVAQIEPLYYVVTGVYIDTATGDEFETPYSQEVLGAPLTVDTRIRDLPGRTQLQIVTDYVAAVQRVDSELSLIPGSTTRDVSIDPFASEAERLWFIVDFVHRSQSFLTLLQIDDANNDGETDLVSASAYKQALKAAVGFSTNDAVQTLIDTQFDKLAGNLQKTRLSGRPAVGQAVFYTTSRPSADVTIPSGAVVAAGSVTFVVGGTYILRAVDAEAYYNFNTKRYEVIADIVASSPGADSNVSAGEITSINSGVTGMQVINTEAAVFGSDRESNGDLATRAQLAYTSVDTGTEGGYASTAAEQIGIIKSKIVKSGDELMMRDWDEVRKKHIGGKVDIWVQGLQERTVTETFAFSFEVARDIPCQIIDVANLIFQVIDTDVTTDTPIIELLDNPSLGLGIRNASQGKDYDLTGATLVNYNTFQLDPLIQTFTTAIDDAIRADYRFRSINRFFFSLQPVRRVISVEGAVSGPLDAALGYDLFKLDDPLLEGESTIADNYLVINQVAGVPSGDVQTVNDETHVMIGFFEESLGNIGINTTSLVVFNEDRSIQFEGPGSASPDYEVIEGTITTPVKIKRTAASNIVSGETVSCDYEHDENFTVAYVINDLLQQLQQTINVRRHITADVLVKQATLNSVEIDTTIQLKSGASKDSVDPAVRSSVSTELNQKLIGQGTAQSDIVNAIDSTNGVDFQVLPLARMGYADGSRKERVSISNDSLRVGSLDIGGNQVSILTTALRYPTTDGGGLPTEHRGVFQDDETMTLADSLATVGQHADGAFIIGSGGAIISGYSDDATITAETGVTNPDDIETERLARTANHVVVSLVGIDSPSEHSYRATYVIRGDTGPHDLMTTQVEHIDLGDFTLTFRAAT